jgi:pyruvate/2-oxoacid:ferredoxin oxidoreductase beta subunit/intein/homing endonuclease
LIVNTILSSTDKQVVVGIATGCLEVASTQYPNNAWKVPYIHSLFENVAPTLSGVEAAYKALRKDGLKKEVKMVAFAGDGATYDIGLQALSGALERGHDMLYVCYDNEGYMNCLALSTTVMTKDGLKKITEIKKGDMIYAFDQITHKLVLKKCTGVFDNGRKPVYELGTLHNSIKATANHPFLVLKRNGRGKKNRFEWKTLADVKIGDQIIVLKNILNKKSHRFGPIRLSKVGDYKVTHINDVKIPRTSNPDLMKYLGIYLGDGWIRVNRGEMGFALPEGKAARKILLDLNCRVFGSVCARTDKNYVYVNSVNIAKFIDSLGFGHGAKSKTIPDWVFTLPDDEKEAFIEGLMLSDGYVIGKSMRYVSASFDLLKRLRLLAQLVGYRVGKIHRQSKKRGVHCVYRPLLKDSEYGYICFSKKEKWNMEKYRNQYRYQNFLIENEFFDTDSIRYKRLVGIEPTLDLRVEGEHNFIADGIVVHNTGNQRSGATPHGANTTTQPAGKFSYGKTQQRKDIMGIIAAHNIPYAAQASTANLPDLIMKAKKAFETKGPSFLNVLCLCPTNWKYEPQDVVKVSQLAVDTRFWPLYEIENGRYKFNYEPTKKVPIEEFLKLQKRFSHLFQPQNKHAIAELQQNIDAEWDKLKRKCVSS